MRRQREITLDKVFSINDVNDLIVELVGLKESIQSINARLSLWSAPGRQESLEFIRAHTDLMNALTTNMDWFKVNMLPSDEQPDPNICKNCVTVSLYILTQMHIYLASVIFNMIYVAVGILNQVE